MNWKTRINPCAISTTRKIAILVGRNKWHISNESLTLMGAIVRVGIIIALLFSLTSCGAQWHLKRAIAKDPTIINDTIVRIDTTIVTNEKTIVDTLVITDTITHTIERDGVVVKIQRIHDTIMVDATCPPDTITINEMIPVERIVYKQNDSANKWMSFVYAIITILVLVFVIRLMK